MTLNTPHSTLNLQLSVTIAHLFISPGHNFYGHHGKPAGSNPIIPVDQIECVAGRGVRGDRFFDYKPDYKGQITFFSMEVLEALRRALNLPDAPLGASRRNVLVRGADLNALMGQEFELQGVRFAGTEESKPCYWMNSALGPGAEEWLEGNGGLRCRILTDGIMRKERHPSALAGADVPAWAARASTPDARNPIHSGSRW